MTKAKSKLILPRLNKQTRTTVARQRRRRRRFIYSPISISKSVQQMFLMEGKCIPGSHCWFVRQQRVTSVQCSSRLDKSAGGPGDHTPLSTAPITMLLHPWQCT
ncbi:hypothetical protein HNY73_003617 [Argiope bruennichi]|uniref:Uncharacterized protein n=1 Tax=Argiope bruennichi TaxID=94029 RepID=A0A8T0FQQ2_ARGBR|nr:hypothetical protein HNY73_003617 [Argiope bruennichi]